MTHEPDYYRLLGVPADATDEQIRRAYHRAAMTAHPDRGGTHEQMVRISRAWETLRDPEFRLAYRRRLRDAAAVSDAHWQYVCRTAEARAHDYPRDWRAFETSLRRLADEWLEARMGGLRFGGMALPSSVRSRGGILSMVLCAALAFTAACGSGAYRELSFRPDHVSPTSLQPARPAVPRVGRLILLWTPILVGGWAGAWAREGLRRRRAHAGGGRPGDTGVSTIDAPASMQHITHRSVRCPTCGGSVLVRRVSDPQAVTCTSCGGAFTHDPLSDAR